MFVWIPNDDVELKRFAFDRDLSKNRNICSNFVFVAMINTE